MPVLVTASINIVSGAVLSVFLYFQLPALVLSVEQLVPVLVTASICNVSGAACNC